MVSYQGWDDNGFSVSGSGFTGVNGTVTFAVPGGMYDISVSADAPTGYTYSGDFGDEDVMVDANDAMTVTNTLVLEIAEGTGTLTKILLLPDGYDYETLESEVYFCQGTGWEFDDCEDFATVTAGYGEEGQAWMTVSADVPAGVYTICTDVEIDTGWDDLDSGEECETTHMVDGVEVPIYVVAGEETVVYNDFDSQANGSLDVYVRDDEDDEYINGADVCVYDTEGMLLDCWYTGYDDDNGMVRFNLPAGTYTVTVSADGYEQESSTFEYSPLEDLSDGDLDDDYSDGDNVEYVSALDPYIT